MHFGNLQKKTNCIRFDNSNGFMGAKPSDNKLVSKRDPLDRRHNIH